MVSAEYYQETPNDTKSGWLYSETSAANRDATIAQKMQIMPSQLNDYMLPEWVDLVIVGDTHKHTVFTLKNKAGKPVVCLSPGALAMQATNELSFGRAFCVYDDLTFESIRFETRPVIQLVINKEIDFDSAIDSAFRLRSTITLPLPKHAVPIVLVRMFEPNGEKWSQLQAAYHAEDGTKLAHLFPLVEKRSGDSQDKMQSVAEAASMLQSVDDLIDYAVKSVTSDDEIIKDLVGKLINNASVDFVLAEEWTKHLEKYTNAT
jgi:hypothetical protein